MVTKAIIKSVRSSNKEVEVYIPLYDGYEDINGQNDLLSQYTATICAPAGVSPHYQVGDVVYICIEDQNPGEPVVMGMLYPNKNDSTISDAVHGSLQVNVNAKLPTDTVIGEVTSENIKHLKNSRSNVQDQMDNNIKQKVELLTFMTDKLSKSLMI